jgi:hypothetical protein
MNAGTLLIMISIVNLKDSWSIWYENVVHKAAHRGSGTAEFSSNPVAFDQ